MALSMKLSEQSDWKSTLAKQGFTVGLIGQIERATIETPLRIWILDNSASMNIPDAYHYFSDTSSPNNLRMVKCTRWQELVETVRYHSQLAAGTKAPTIFRLLNSYPGIPSEYSIAQKPIFDTDDMNQQLSTIMKNLETFQPTGPTPLTAHIYNVRNSILAIQPSLLVRNQHFHIIIATDGLPSDEKGCTGNDEAQLFFHALRMLEKLSIRLVIRLCTNEESVKKVSDTHVRIL